MTCRELTDFLDRYLGDELEPSEKEEIERHLAVCEACVRYLESYRRTVELGREAWSASDQDVPPSVPEELIKAILAARALEP